MTVCLPQCLRASEFFTVFIELSVNPDLRTLVDSDRVQHTKVMCITYWWFLFLWHMSVTCDEEVL